VSVIVPCLNEERNLPYVFERMPAEVDEVVLVDGGSVDRTVERARELWPSIRVVHQTRRGKGNALVCGFAACTGDIIVMIDADGSTDPAEVPQFVRALVEGADFAKGSRFAHGGDSHDITRIRRLGNSALSLIVNLMFRTRYSDLCYGYNAFWRWVVPYLDLPDPALPAQGPAGMLWGDGFEIETLINVRVAALGLRVGEVPSVEAARIHGVSNLNAFRDGNRVLRTIVREYRHRRSMPPVVRPAEAVRDATEAAGVLRDATEAAGVLRDAAEAAGVDARTDAGASALAWNSRSDPLLAESRQVGLPAMVTPAQE
jgi:glycosyltransferase involved in cell wall biosynthesis